MYPTASIPRNHYLGLPGGLPRSRDHCVEGFRYLLLLIACLPAFAVGFADSLPGTQVLDWAETDLSQRLMDGAHRFVERKIADAGKERAKLWKYDFSSPLAYVASVEENRNVLRTILGVVDPRLPAGMERFGDELNPALVSQTETFRVYQVRWPVLEGVDGEGLLVQPAGVAVARVVVVPDADQTPEQLLGLAPGLPRVQQVGRRLAENGCELVIPTLVDRRPLVTDDPVLGQSQQTSREWIYRQAYHMGRHIIGYEVQRVLAAVDWFEKTRSLAPGAKIGVAGFAEGGLIAFHVAALDTRVDAALISGYFESRERVWAEPIYRNVWSRLVRFGDALPHTICIAERIAIAGFAARQTRCRLLYFPSSSRSTTRSFGGWPRSPGWTGSGLDSTG